MNKNIFQKIATSLANSIFLRSGKLAHEKYIHDWQMEGMFVRKLLANIYLIVNDYGKGTFPPKINSREETYRGEREQFESWDFQSLEETIAISMTKPFSFPSHLLQCYLWSYGQITETLERRGVTPGTRLLEFGCGMGWLSELLAFRGYDVTGSTIAQIDVKHAKQRVQNLKGRGGNRKLSFFCCPMEEVHKHVDLTQPFDASFCFEALHHAYDWRESLESVAKCIRSGGQLFLFSEPPTLHTYLCYRSAMILKTHEIGFKKADLVRHLASLGFTDIEVRRPVQIRKISDFWRPLAPFVFGGGSLMARSFWIAARKN